MSDTDDHTNSSDTEIELSSSLKKHRRRSQEKKMPRVSSGDDISSLIDSAPQRPLSRVKSVLPNAILFIINSIHPNTITLGY